MSLAQKEAIKQTSKRWRDANREHLRATNKQWRSEHAREIQEGRNRRYCHEPLFKLKRCLRARVLEAFKVNKWLKTGKHAEILGCTYEEAKAHLEKQFTNGMTWANHGNGEGKWNIDHIVPLDIAKTPDDLVKLNHYSNLQPLWWRNNLTKGNKT